MKKLFYCIIFFFIPLLSFAGGEALLTDKAFATFGGLLAAIPIVFEFIKKLFKLNLLPYGKTVIQILSWVTGILITLTGWLLKLGMFEEMTLKMTIITGILASLAANGVADTKIIKKIFAFFAKK